MEERIKSLNDLVHQQQEEIAKLKSLIKTQDHDVTERSNAAEGNISDLTSEEITRYSRQLILPAFGKSGQIALKKASVLIVGAGGLGCPIGIYLAAAGVGNIGVVDYDTVEVSNLHRQIAHTVRSVGENKTESLRRHMKNINPEINCKVYTVLLKSSNIEKIIEPYSIIIDASDNVPTRYLLNDAAVLFKKYLVSGSALRFEGQLTVYNYLDGPCYRCLFPKPPSADNVSNCSESGVLGAVTGVIGSLQALEVIKLAIGEHPTYYKKMLLFDGFHGDLRVIKLRGRKPDCEVCGNSPIKELVDYEEFCKRSSTDKTIDIALLDDMDRISCIEYQASVVGKGVKHILLDVRPSYETDICGLPNSVNIPIDVIEHQNSLDKLTQLIAEVGSSNNYVICRRGNDSQRAVLTLRKCLPNCNWRDIKGGLRAWHHDVDLSFPLY